MLCSKFSSKFTISCTSPLKPFWFTNSPKPHCQKHWYHYKLLQLFSQQSYHENFSTKPDKLRKDFSQMRRSNINSKHLKKTFFLVENVRENFLGEILQKFSPKLSRVLVLNYFPTNAIFIKFYPSMIEFKWDSGKVWELSFSMVH